MNDRREHPYLRVSGRNADGHATEWALHTCPAPDCREPIPEGPRQVPEHIESHDPEDFGLGGENGADDGDADLEREREVRGEPPVAGGGGPP